jgi:dTDP-4-amino-4,6-dideoxygalactose transaminase
LRQYGWGERFRVETAGGRNSRLDSLQAAVLSARLPFLDARNAHRREIANRYRDLLTLHGDATNTVAHHAVALVSERDAVRGRLHAEGIVTEVHYPYLVHEMPGLGLEPVSTPAASGVRDRILSLPCFPELTDDEVDRVCTALRTVTR